MESLVEIKEVVSMVMWQPSVGANKRAVRVNLRVWNRNKQRRKQVCTVM